LTIAITLFFFLFFLPSTNKLGFFFEKLCLFGANSTNLSILGNFSNVFNITKLKKKEKRQVLFF